MSPSSLTMSHNMQNTFIVRTRAQKKAAGLNCDQPLLPNAILFSSIIHECGWKMCAEVYPLHFQDLNMISQAFHAAKSIQWSHYNHTARVFVLPATFNAPGQLSPESWATLEAFNMIDRADTTARLKQQHMLTCARVLSGEKVAEVLARLPTKIPRSICQEHRDGFLTFMRLACGLENFEEDHMFKDWKLDFQVEYISKSTQISEKEVQTYLETIPASQTIASPSASHFPSLAHPYIRRSNKGKRRRISDAPNALLFSAECVYDWHGGRYPAQVLPVRFENTDGLPHLNKTLYTITRRTDGSHKLDREYMCLVPVTFEAPGRLAPESQLVLEALNSQVNAMDSTATEQVKMLQQKPAQGAQVAEALRTCCHLKGMEPRKLVYKACGFKPPEECYEAVVF